MNQDLFAQAQQAQQQPAQNNQDMADVQEFVQGGNTFGATMGMTHQGGSPEELVNNIVILLQKAGLYDQIVQAPNGEQQLMADLQAFAEAMINKDEAALKESVIPQLLNKAGEILEGALGGGEQAPAQDPMVLAQQAKGV